MPLPNFLCVGAQKAGTTTLHDILIQHPEIYLPEIKETKFFQDNSKYKKGLDYYEKEFFGKWNGEKAVGEIDPEYMYFEYVPERIYKHLGKDVKIIFMLRNPVDRAYSHYWMSYRRGYETETFERAIELEEERIKINEFHKNHFSYIDRGLYAKQIKRYLKFFSKENMFFIIFETEFLKDREKTIKSLLKFLEVDTKVVLDLNIKSNPASMPRLKMLRDFIYKPNYVKKVGKFLMPSKKLRQKILMTLDKINQKPMKPPELSRNVRKKLLSQYFIDDIKDLEIILEKDLRIWYE
ncbi:sulfotransferase domain-containing protein [Thermosulfurimonas marina]|uniref:Sulfotransferase domain-containing protein n=1 Tax=Thermosulfurimonas marina TaxID=2047767 RepID=A0A6H1WRP9_9BACT|nr:sulfotransferase [Thermosulfurimonas marina]QJA05897.1 sulfotransferase domain-containing protein [Thermosulfurimonas marina]